ncbi:MAG TPA: hypothetical protein VIK29_10455, partial [Paludibacter sp.]
MKKQFYTLVLMLLVATSGFAQFILKATVPSTTLICYAAGNFNGWSATATPMDLVSTDETTSTKVFGVELPFSFIGSGTFKILAGPEWKFEQSDLDPQFSATTDLT